MAKKLLSSRYIIVIGTDRGILIGDTGVVAAACGAGFAAVTGIMAAGVTVAVASESGCIGNPMMQPAG